MEDRKFVYEIYREGALSGLGEPGYSGVLWAQNKDAALEAACAIARMRGLTVYSVHVDEIREGCVR